MRILFSLIIWGVGAFALFSQTLDECREMARNHYPEIQRYDLIASTEQFNLSNAARSWIPQVVFSGQATYQTATPTYPEAFNSMLAANGLDMAGIRNDQYKLALDVNQNIWDGGRSKANRAIAEAEAIEQRSQMEVSLYDLQSRVDNLYFSILLLDERITQTKTMIEVLESNLNRMKTYYNNGVVRQADVDRVEAELLTARQTLGQVESMRLSYRSVLETFVGQSLVDEKLQRPVVSEELDTTSVRPELIWFDTQKTKLEAQQQLIKTSVMPTLNAFAQAYYGYPGMDMFKSMVSSEWTFNAIVGVRLNWNISAFYLKQNNLEKINLAKSQVDVQKDLFQFNSKMQVVQQDGEIARLRKALEDDDRIVELRRSVGLSEESKLKNGVIDATDLLKTISEETTAALNRTTHEIELLQAIYKLKTILNQ